VTSEPEPDVDAVFDPVADTVLQLHVGMEKVTDEEYLRGPPSAD
jgi:hypothetical protein